MQFLAGGTTLVDLMKLDVLRPERLVDITLLADRHAGIEAGPQGLRLGALARMSAAADHADVRRDYPVIAQALDQAASAQLRNMATIGGNLLQRTRCPYFRDPSWTACNKRTPGSGCTALTAPNRNHAVLGVDDSCISQYPGDLGVALVALGAEIELSGPGAAPAMAFADLHRAAEAASRDVETNLRARRGDHFRCPRAGRRSRTRRSALSGRCASRASYEVHAIASAAVALDLDGEVVLRSAHRPWRNGLPPLARGRG